MIGNCILVFKSDDKSSLDVAISAMNRCISDLRNWMIRDRLTINDDKTELILIGTRQHRQQLGKINDVCNISVGDYDIYPSSSVRNLGAWFDNLISCQRQRMLLKYVKPRFISYIILEGLRSIYLAIRY